MKRPRARSIFPTQFSAAVAAAAGNGIVQNPVANQIVATDNSAPATSIEVILTNDAIASYQTVLAQKLGTQTALMTTTQSDMDGIQTSQRLKQKCKIASQSKFI